jgi:enoyl-CoA hydratase
MNYKYIIYEGKDSIARIILNRPEKLNALSWPLLAELSEALKKAEKDRNVKVIIIKGAGPCFSAGHDMSSTAGRDIVSTMGEAPKDMDATFEKLDSTGVTVWDSRAHVQGHVDYALEIWNNWKPVIAQVHGYCLAGATGIALMCDLLIASDDARMGYPPVRSLATGDEIVLFSWHVGLKKAKELSLTGDSLTAQEMLHYGIANYVVPRDELEEVTTKIAKRIANIHLETLALSKRVVCRTFDLMGFTTSMQYGGEYDSLAHMFREPNGEIMKSRKMRRDKGLKAHLEWRDRPFGGIMGRYPDPRVK